MRKKGLTLGQVYSNRNVIAGINPYANYVSVQAYEKIENGNLRKVGVRKGKDRYCESMSFDRAKNVLNVLVK